MSPVLYYSPGSPPCQLVLLVAKHLNLYLELKPISREDRKLPEFLKKNPAGAIPTLDDNGLYLPESRAIAIYLLEQYGNNDSLLPTDPKSRALVNHRLFFDLGVLNQRAVGIARPLVVASKLPTHETFNQLEEGLGFLDAFLEGRKWLVGDGITIADYAVLISVALTEIIPLVAINKFPNVAAWYDLAKKTVAEYDEIVAPNMEITAKSSDGKFFESEIQF